MRAVEATVAVRQLVLTLADQIAARSTASVKEILGRSKFAHVVRARHELMAALWAEGLSTTVIGLALGVDHTTVMHGVRRVLGDDYRVRVAERYPLSRARSYRGKVRVAS